MITKSQIIVIILILVILYLSYLIFKKPVVEVERFYSEASGSSIEWTQLGKEIVGQEEEDYSGWSVSLSSDGTVVAIGALYNDGNGENSGHVRVYRYTGDGWTQLGGDIVGENGRDLSGSSVSLSSDSDRTVVAIGANSNDGDRNDSDYDSGHVRVYEYDENKINNVTNQDSPDFGPKGWRRMGGDIDGEYEGDFSGSSVSLSSDGTVVAIGANSNDDNGNNSGHVRVYMYDKNKTDRVTNQVSPDFGPKGWRRIGGDIDGKMRGDFSGISVSLSSNGAIVAIGANGNSNDTGLVRIFKNNFLSNLSKTPTTQSYRTSPTAQTNQYINLNCDNVESISNQNFSRCSKSCESLNKNDYPLCHLFQSINKF